MRKIWRLWCLALGEKPTKCNKESDKIALFRTFIIFQTVITNLIIALGVIRHW
jgi:hypothetical protein